MPKELKNGLFALLICSLLVTFCYFWVDQPVVFWANNHHSRDYPILGWFTHIPEFFIALTCLLFALLAVRFCYGKWNKNDEILLTILGSIVIADFLHTPLKIVFGRYWPETWVNNNPSLLRNHVYGFNWFHFGTAYASFPSGHTCNTVAVMAMIWFLYPRWRWLSVLIILLVATSLIGMYYHFVSDVIAGGFLGALTAYYLSIFYTKHVRR